MWCLISPTRTLHNLVLLLHHPYSLGPTSTHAGGEDPVEIALHLQDVSPPFVVGPTIEKGWCEPCDDNQKRGVFTQGSPTVPLMSLTLGVPIVPDTFETTSIFPDDLESVDGGAPRWAHRWGRRSPIVQQMKLFDPTKRSRGTNSIVSRADHNRTYNTNTMSSSQTRRRGWLQDVTTL